MARMSATVSCTCSCLLLALVLLTGSQGYVRFCYFSNWAQFRVNASFTPLDIDPALCTHILYSFAALNNSQIVPIEYNDFTLYSQINSLKKVNPKLKVLLAIGGWDANNTHFTHLVSSSAIMAGFAQNAIGYLREHKFDGLDIDWEYPAGRGGPASDRAGFTALLQTLKTAFTEEANVSKLPILLLTAAVVAPIQQANNYYQIDQIGRHLDFINIMTYDLHGSWEQTTGIHCALYQEVDDCVSGWLTAGAPRDKIVLGIAAYGRTYTLASTSMNPPNSGLGQRAVGPGAAGPSTQASGSLAYYEICQTIERNNWTETYIATKDSPVAYGRVGNVINWVGYDNIPSVRAKAKYIRDRGLAGSLIWSLDQDDFKNTCGENRFPLSSALLEQLPSDGEVTTPRTELTTEEVTTTHQVTTTTIEETTATEGKTTTTTAEPTTTTPDQTTTTSEPTTTTAEPTTTTPNPTTTTSEPTTTTSEPTTTTAEPTTTTPDPTTTTVEPTTTTAEPTTTTAEPTTTEAKTIAEKTTVTTTVGSSDDSTPTDPGWVTTTPTPTTTSSTGASTSTTTRRPLIKRPRIPFFRPIKRNRCSLRLGDARSHSAVQGDPQMFVARNFGFMSIVCRCPGDYVYNPCIRRCDFRTNRATCTKWF